MIQDFFSGQVNLLSKRHELLNTSFNQHFHSLPVNQQKNRAYYARFLDRRAKNIRSLLRNRNLGRAELFAQQLINYRLCVQKMILFEQGPVSVLYHFSAKDNHICAFINRFCDQIHYPCTYPLVSTQSNQSFYSQPHFNLIYSNVLEGDFLLASPDLVHELGHLFFYFYRGEDFFAPFLEHLHHYIQQIKNVRKENFFTHHFHHLSSRIRGVIPTSPYNFNLLESNWKKRYLEEFACDMFATYLVGPAFGLSHLRLLLGDRAGLYVPSMNHPGTHPANEARMRGILLVLHRLGDHSALGNELTRHWDEYKQKMLRINKRRDRPDEGYNYCYNRQLLEELAQLVISACQAKKLIPYYDQPADDRNNIASVMQMAWRSFLRDPANYGQWETNMIQYLKSSL